MARSTAAHPVRQLLLGGGPAHVQVLAAWARGPRPAGVERVLVLSSGRWFDPRLLPGCLAGRRPASACVIPLEPWARAAGVRVLTGRAVAWDAARRRLQIEQADGRIEALDYDGLSLDLAPDSPLADLPGGLAHTVPACPPEALLPLWRQIVADALEHPFRLAVIGAGARGVELALAARQALPADRSVLLIEDAAGLLPGWPAALRARIARGLARQGVGRQAGQVTAADEDGLWLRPLQAGAVPVRLDSDATLLASDGRPPHWLSRSGLQLDEAGRLAVGPTLQSRSHPEVFAVGGMAGCEPGSAVRDGVDAVRAGPVLARNLDRALAGEGPWATLAPLRPPAVHLLASGAGRALLGRGDWGVEGRGVAWWKAYLDGRFVARWQPPRG